MGMSVGEGELCVESGNVRGRESVRISAEPFEEPLILSVEDRIGPNKDDVLGRCMLPLQYVERRLGHKAINTRPFNLEKHVMVVEGEKKKEGRIASPRSVLMEMKLKEDEDESRSCCADEEELNRKEMTKRGLKNEIFDDSLDDFSVRKPDMCTEVVPPVQFRISKHADRGANAILIVVMVVVDDQYVRICHSPALTYDLWTLAIRPVAMGGSHNEKEYAIGFLEAWKIPGVAPFAVSVEYLRKDQRCQDKVEDENDWKTPYAWPLGLHNLPICSEVGVLIGKPGDAIQALQNSSAARVQITRDAGADPHSANSQGVHSSYCLRERKRKDMECVKSDGEVQQKANRSD
ncbi:FT-interacting protein 1-like protein [Tanacetum coccineum]